MPELQPKTLEKNKLAMIAIAHRTNHPRYLLQSESSSKSGNYIKVVNEFIAETSQLSNGRWAMIGITSLIGAYATTVQIIAGFF